MTGAIMGKAKLHGLITDNKKIIGAIGLIDLSGLEDDELDRKLKQLENLHDQSTND